MFLCFMGGGLNGIKTMGYFQSLLPQSVIEPSEFLVIEAFSSHPLFPKNCCCLSGHGHMVVFPPRLTAFGGEGAVGGSKGVFISLWACISGGYSCNIISKRAASTDI